MLSSFNGSDYFLTGEERGEVPVNLEVPSPISISHVFWPLMVTKPA